jgi:glucosamine--fructose-6-phosphate aminotransferase (isomerizing)
MPRQVEAQLEQSLADVAGVDRYASIQVGTVVGRGINYGSAFEIALKIRELSGLLFEAWSAADLMHGPVAAIAPGWPMIAVAPSGPALDSMETVIEGLASRGARLLVIADAERPLAHAETALRLVPGVPEWLSPLVTVIPGQLVALRLAELRGGDVDRPHGLQKVTLTT